MKGMGVILGPLVGAQLYHRLGYAVVFYVNALILGCMFIVLMFIVHSNINVEQKDNT